MQWKHFQVFCQNCFLISLHSLSGRHISTQTQLQEPTAAAQWCRELALQAASSAPTAGLTAPSPVPPHPLKQSCPLQFWRHTQLQKYTLNAVGFFVFSFGGVGGGSNKWWAALTCGRKQRPGKVLWIMEAWKHSRGWRSAEQVKFTAYLELVGIQLHLLPNNTKTVSLCITFFLMGEERELRLVAA